MDRFHYLTTALPSSPHFSRLPCLLMEPVRTTSRERAPTIRDVARHAHVGVGTVSRVLNDSPQVSADARDRVRRTIDELGYRRSSTARNLSLGRTQTIGVVAPFFTSGSVLERLRGVVDRLRQDGEYDLLLFDVETLAQRADAFRAFARKDRVDGLLIMSLRPTDAEVESLQHDGLAVVLVDVRHSAFPRRVHRRRPRGRNCDRAPAEEGTHADRIRRRRADSVRVHFERGAPSRDVSRASTSWDRAEEGAAAAGSSRS